jgi:hypothetical protein
VVVFAPRTAEERVETRAERVQDGADGTRRRLDEVDVFGIAPRWGEKELVQRCAAPKANRRGKARIPEDLHEGAGQDQVLLDLGVLRPGREPAPMGDGGFRDHASAST